MKSVICDGVVITPSSDRIYIRAQDIHPMIEVFLDFIPERVNDRGKMDSEPKGVTLSFETQGVMCGDALYTSRLLWLKRIGEEPFDFTSRGKGRSG